MEWASAKETYMLTSLWQMSRTTGRYKNTEVQCNSMASGVFKGRRTRHLPRPPFVGAPQWGVAHVKYTYFWLKKNLLFTHIMYYKEGHK